MTLIQCYCPTLIENMAGCLRLQPEKLILLGDEAQMREPARRYRTIAAAHGISMQLNLCHIPGKGISEIAALLAKTLRQEADCVIDLTGCDELVAMAIGAMLATGKDLPPVSVQRYDMQKNLDIDCDGDGQVIPGKDATLTVPELISLFGGTIHPGTYQPMEDYSARDLDGLWAMVAAAPKDWNRSLTVLGEFESRSYSDTDILLPLDPLRDSISNFQEKEDLLRELLDQFHSRGIIQDRSSRDFLKYRYPSDLMRHCTEKAGNVLEVKALLEARPFFQDSRMGVSIDWDGVIYDPEERIPETRNEIDLVLMQGLTPLFVSCKNGSIGEEELYKLHTVATRFGGPYAKKMLIATDLAQKSPAANRAFIQRAWDMDIYLVTDGAQLDRQEWQDIFKTAMQ